MRPARKAQAKSFSFRDLFEGKRKWYSIVPACLLLIAGGWWAYTKLRTLPPPPVASSSPQDVASFFGDPNGFVRMPVEQREQYLMSVYQHYARGPGRQEYVQALRRMSPTQRRIFMDGVYDITKMHVMRHADAYSKLRTPREKAQYVDKAIRDFERMQRDMSGAGGGGAGGGVAGGPGGAADMAAPFQGEIPSGSEAIQKVIVEKSSPSERAKAEPFVQRTVERYQQLKDPGARRQFDAGS